MSFTPILVSGGYAGWRFLERTLDKQRAVFDAVPTFKRDEDYFRAKIGTINTAEELVNDQRLLKVALGAFGLDSDLRNKAFIRKVLQDGTLTDGALSNRLANKQYEKLSAAFGFGDFSTPRTKLSSFPDEVLTAYKTRQFEAAVGEKDNDMRLALNAKRELGALADRRLGADAKWFTIMGNAPLRQVFQTALGLPASFGGLDLDQQLTVFKERAQRQFGDSGIDQFSDPDRVEALVRQFLVRSEIANSNSAGTRASGLLQLIRGASASGADVLGVLR